MSKTEAGNWEVPWDRDGNMLSYPTWFADRQPDGSYTRVESAMSELPPFRGRLKVIDVQRGQSAARFTMQDIETGHTYPMFMIDILALLEDVEFDGTWTAQKRGSNYGVMRTST